MKRSLTAIAVVVLAAGSLAAAAFAGPTFDKDGKLIVPQGRDAWPVVGTTYALSYEGVSTSPTFNTVRMDPESYAAYVKTGKYPAGSMLDLEVRAAATEISPAKGGQTEGKVLGRSIHIKDEKAGPGTWTFYSFGVEGKTGSPIARTQACYSCHQDSGKDDTTFTQFYPSMLEAKDKAAKAAAGSQ